MATIPSTNYSSAAVIQEAAGSIRAFNSNDTDVRTLAGVLTGSYSSADWAGKSAKPLINFVATRLDAYPDIESPIAYGGINQFGEFVFWDAYNSTTTRYLPPTITTDITLYEAMLSNPVDIGIVGAVGYDNVIRAFNTWYTPNAAKTLLLIYTTGFGTKTGYCTLTLREKANTSNMDTIQLYVNYTNA